MPLLFACRDAMERWVEAEEGSLAGGDLARYRLHMVICPYCRECRRQLSATRTLARQMPPEPPPPAVEEAAMAAFRSTFPTGRSPARKKPDDV
jgi:hypothetical protein